MWNCEICEEENYDNIEKCWNCGSSKDGTYKASGNNVKFVEAEEYKPEFKPHKDVILTTAPFLEGYSVNNTIDIITAECVFGINFFRDFFAGVTDILGGRSESTQTVLRNARKICLDELRKEAYGIGANAVIAVDLDYSEFSGKGKSMLFLVASGTAVKVEKKD